MQWVPVALSPWSKRLEPHAEYSLPVHSVYRLGYWLDEWGSSTSMGNDAIFLLRHRVQIGYEAHPASYQMGTVALTPEGKAVGA